MRATTLLLLLPAAALAAAAAPHYDGAGFDFALPTGLTVRESYNGDVYFLEVVRPDAGPDHPLPLLRFYVVPNRNVDLASLLGRVREESCKVLVSDGRKAGADTVRTTKVAGLAATEIALPFTRGGAGAGTLRLLSLLDQEQRVVIAAFLEGDADGPAVDGILGSLRPKKLTPDSLLRVSAVGIAFRVPLTTRVEWKNQGDRMVVGNFGLSEGVLRLVLRKFGTETAAREAEERAREEHASRLAEEVAANGGRLLRSATALLTIHDRVRRATRHEIVLGDGRRRDALLYLTNRGRIFLAFTFLGDADGREAMEARIRQVLGSLEGEPPPPAPATRFVGFGLSVTMPAGAGITPAKDGSPSLTVDWPGARPSPVLRIRAAAAAGTSRELHAAALKAAGAPAEGRKDATWPIDFLGAPVTALVTTWPKEDSRDLLATLDATTGTQRVTLSLRADGAAGPELRAGLPLLLKGIAAATKGTFSFPGAGLSLPVDPTRMTAAGNGGDLHLTADDFVLDIETRAAAPGADLARLVGRKLGDLHRAHADEIRDATGEQSFTRSLMGEAADGARSDVTFLDGGPGRLETLAVALKGREIVLSLVVRNRASEEAAEEIEALLSGLRPE